jgi:hypothetical protein
MNEPPVKGRPECCQSLNPPDDTCTRPNGQHYRFCIADRYVRASWWRIRKFQNLPAPEGLIVLKGGES